MKNFLLISAIAILAAISGGCAHTRYVAYAKVDNLGAQGQISTQNRYTLKTGYFEGKEGNYSALKSLMTTQYPGVFSDNGIPFNLHEGSMENFKSRHEWTFLFPYLLSMGTLPLMQRNQWDRVYRIEFPEGKGSSQSFTSVAGTDLAFTCWTPIALFLYNGKPRTLNHKNYYTHDKSKFSEVVQSAIAYGIAVRLREMETSGQVPTDAVQMPRPVQMPKVEIQVPGANVQRLQAAPPVPVSPQPAVEEPQVMELDSFQL